MSRASAITTTTTRTQITAMRSSRPTREPNPPLAITSTSSDGAMSPGSRSSTTSSRHRTKYSTCLDLSTVLTIAASSTQIVVGGSTTLTATLKVVDADAYGRLGGNAVSGRTVTLQRRAVGTTTWISRRNDGVRVRHRHLCACPIAGRRDRVPSRLLDARRPRASTATVRQPCWSTSPAAAPAPSRSQSRRSRSNAPEHERSGSDVPLDRPTISRSRCSPSRCWLVRALARVRRGRRRRAWSAPRRPPTGRRRSRRPRRLDDRVAVEPTEPPAAIARGRGRRPGHRPAGHVHLGRRRLGQPVAAGLADRRRHRRAPDRHDRAVPSRVATWSAKRDPAGSRRVAPERPVSGRAARRSPSARPETGSWSVQVTVDFDGGLGSASYYWLVTVR